MTASSLRKITPLGNVEESSGVCYTIGTLQRKWGDPLGYNRKQYLNQLVSFDFYGCNHIALCVEIDEDGKLICYRARKKRFCKPAMEVPVAVPEQSL